MTVTSGGNPITPPLDFGNVVPGLNATQVVRIANTGGNTLTITTPSITGDYSMTTLPSSLEPNTYFDATVTFTPTANGTRTGTLSFTHNATGSPYNLSLTGNGQQTLVTYYPFSGNTNDASGYGNNGSTTPGANFTTDRYGNANSALSFNGSTGKMTAPNSETLPRSYVTVSAWVNLTAFNNTQGQLFVGRFSNGTTINPAFCLELFSPTGTSGTYVYPNMAVWTSDQMWTRCIGPTPISLNQWTFLCGTYDGSNVKLYVNGSLVATLAKAGLMNSTTFPVEVGAHANDFMFTNGKIDEVKIYNYALSASEIQALYTPPVLTVTSGGNPITPPLNFGSVLLTATSQKVIRLTNTGGNTLTISNPVITGDYSMSAVPASLEPSTFSDVTVTFTPTVVGILNGTFSFTHNATGSPYSLSLTGTGLSYTSGGVPVTGSGGTLIPWTPVLPNDPGTANQPPIDIEFPGTSGTTPSLVNVSYRSTAPIPASPPFLPTSSIGRYWTLTQNGGLTFDATLTFRFTATEDPNNLRAGSIIVARSTDNGATWSLFASGLSAIPNGSAFEVLVPNVDEFSVWALGSDYVLPVEMTAFSATGGNSVVHLQWRTETEINNSHFLLYRSNSMNIHGEVIARISGHGTSPISHVYNYTDATVQNGVMYYYRIADVGFDGSQRLHPFVAQATPTIQAPLIVYQYQLNQNYPNPFNPTTEISYSIREAGNVDLSIYDLNGKLTATLVNEFQTPNNYRVQFDASHLPTGIYFYKLRTTDFVSMRYMILMR